MDNAQKAIMIGVGLFITLIVISTVMLIAGKGQDILNSSTKKLGTISSQLESQLTQEFDNKIMTGAQVLSHVKSYYNSTEIGIAVRNGKNATKSDGDFAYCGAYGLRFSIPIPVNPVAPIDTTNSPTEFQTNNSIISSKNTTKKATSTNKNPLSDFTNENSVNAYISTTSTYKAELVRLNGAVIGVVFLRTL